MIQKLELKSFGKFRQKRFNLAGVTIFLGNNESGKTTIFDALFQELCQPRMTKKRGMALKERYGEDREAQLIFGDKALRMDEDEFMNLLAIRSGDILLEMASGSSWLEKVKSGLFTGGIDPKRLVNTFERKSSDKGSYSQNINLKKLEITRDKLKEELDILNKKRDELIDFEKNITGKKPELSNRKEILNKKEKK